MSIVPMIRVTLCGITRHKAAVIEGLQALGVLHIVPLREPGPLTPGDAATRRRAETAFRHIMEAPERLCPYRRAEEFRAGAVIGEIIANRQHLRELADRRDELEALIEGLEPWGDFTLPDAEEIGGQRLWLYALPLKVRAALDGLTLPWAIVGRTPTERLVAVIAPDEPPVTLLPVPRTATGTAPLSALRAQLEALEITLEKAERARAELSRWRLLLGLDLAAAQDSDDRRAVAALTLDEGEVFAIQGWAPAAAVAGLAAFAEDHGLALVTEAPGPGDTPPTLLHAQDERAAVGGDLTSFFASPGYRSWDPSLIVFASFAVFFAMIVADAGYAALFALGTGLFWNRLGATPVRRRARVLLTGLSGAALVYGILAGSYFGVHPPEGGLLARLRIIDTADFQKMMVVSVAIGCLHIAIALGTNAWLNRGTPQAIVSLGWIGVILGGLLIWLGGDGLRQAGVVVLVAGLGAVFWGSGTTRPVTRPADWLLRASDGFLGVTRVTKLFGDILSYLRLFALGLASASLAATFNDLAGQIRELHPGIGLLLAIMVLVFGHAINVAIGIMSGVVHGLRLNYIEFFGWGLTEEGYPFRAFARRESPA